MNNAYIFKAPRSLLSFTNITKAMYKRSTPRHLRIELITIALTALVGAPAGMLLLGDSSTHSAATSSLHALLGVLFAVAAYLVGDLFRDEISRLLWGMGIRPWGVKRQRADRMMAFIDFLLRNPSDVAELVWGMTGYHGANGQKKNEEFKKLYGRLILRIYDRVPRIAASGGKVRLGARKRAKRSMTIIDNLTGLMKGSHNLDLLVIPKHKADLVSPMLFIRMKKSGRCFAFDELMFEGTNKHKTRFGASKYSPEHTALVLENLEKLLGSCKAFFQPKPDRPIKVQKQTGN